MREYKLYFGGQWMDQTDGWIADDFNPMDGSLFAKVHMGGPTDIQRAVDNAQTAFPAWSNTPPDQRERILLKAADCLAKIQDEAVETLICESGSAWQKAMGEVMGTIGILKTAAGECRRISSEVYEPVAEGNFSYSVRTPLGVVLAIAPFNYPLLLAMKKVAYILAAGNTCILKPASATPACDLLIAKVFHEAGLPAGVLNVIPCKGSEIGDRLVEHPAVKAVTFTGSSQVGIEIAQRAAKHLKRYTMELGGKNPMIVLADFEVDQAVHLAGYGAFYHQGQVCMATSRIIVEQPIYEEFCTKMIQRAQGMKIGDPHDHDTVIGPLIDEKQCAVIDAQIQDAVSKGARLLTGGHHNGPVYEPTVLADVTPEMEIFYEESFGPVTNIVRAKDAEDALRLCNDNRYGLSSALLTHNLEKAISLSRRMEIGKVHINDTSFVSGTVVPSGGFKMSGCGKEGGRYSIEEFTELKWVTIQYKEKKLPV